MFLPATGRGRTKRKLTGKRVFLPAWPVPVKNHIGMICRFDVLQPKRYMFSSHNMSF
jgi:hypothetical protein